MSSSTLHRSLLACALAAVLGAAAPAHAVLVAPGATVNLPGTTSAAEPFLAGTVIEDELIQFSLPVSQQNPSLITGTVQQRVVRETGTGTLDFYWRITELAGGSLGYFRVGSFVNEIFDANFRTDGLGDLGPASITRFMPGMGGATDIYGANFNFVGATGGDSLAAGQQSYFMFLHTDATDYAKTAFFDVASTGTFTASASFAAFAPAPIPEPTTTALMLAGLLAVGLLAQRRRGRG